MLLAVMLGIRESYEDWQALGRDLIARGLGAPMLIVADGGVDPVSWTLERLGRKARAGRMSRCREPVRRIRRSSAARRWS
jgi:hypothetical protein